MKENVTSRVDPQGRMMIPVHIRKALDLQPGDELSVCVDQLDGTIIVASMKERCCLCGESAETSVTIGHRKKLICRNCASQIRKAVK